MDLNNYLKPKMQLIGMLSLLVGLTSCGSYQYAGYDDDSIYGSSERIVEYQEETTTSTGENSAYYQNYFRDKALELEDNEDVIFTDIDSYESYSVENDSLFEDHYAGWGYDNSDVTITIYNRPYFNSYWNWAYPYNRWYSGWGWGYGFHDWYSPYYIGWHRPFFYGYNYPYFYSPYYYGGYYNSYYNGYYSNRRLAYNAGRRGSIYSNSISGIINRNNIASRNTVSRRNTVGTTTSRRSSSRFNSEVVPRRSFRLNSNSTRPRTMSRPRVNTSRPRTTTKSKSINRRPTSTKSNTIIRRSNNSSRSNNVSRSSSSTRSSSSVSRSSNSSSRSSGSRTSTSRRKNN